MQDISSSAKRSGRSAVIVGTGSYVPERVMTNAELENMVNTTDEWIVTRTGMKERRIAREDEMTSDMAAEAARRAIENAELMPEDIDLILVATITPDRPWPNTACLVQDKIGAVNAGCMGLEAACSGFLYALETARSFVVSGGASTVLVVGAEKMSSILDWEDRSTCVLFGDGASAAVVQSKEDVNGIMGTVMGSDGSLSEVLMVPAGGCRLPASRETVDQRLHFLRMNGRETFRHAVTKMTEAAVATLEHCGVSADEINWLIPHQANMRIIRAVGQRLGVPMSRFINNVEKYGNTSSATIGIALDEAVRSGKIQRGDRVLLVAFGGGFTWGAMLMEWHKS